MVKAPVVMIAYLITNLINDKKYVGAAAKIREAAKRAALAACLAIAIFWPNSAGAQLAVFDSANFLQQVKDSLTQLKQYATELQQLQQEVQTVTWVATTAQSMIQNPNLGSVMALMGQLGLNVDLPLNPYAVQGILNGYTNMSGLGSITGALSGLNGLVNTNWSVDHVYSCTTQTFSCYQQNQMANSTAGLKGIMGTMYQDLASHIQILQGLRTDALAAADPAQREHVLDQIALENAWAQNTGAQIQTATAMAMAARQANEDRANEMLNQDVSTFISSIPKGG